MVTQHMSFIATVNGLYSAGGAVGCLLFMWLAELFGRLRTIQLGALVAILGGALQGSAANINMFYAGRLIAGMAIGMLVSCTPLYLSELSAPASRGRQVGVQATFLVLGYFMASWVGYGCYFATPVNPSFAWRFPVCFQTLPPLLLLLGSPWAEEAWTILQRIHAHSHFAKEEFHQMTQQVKLEEERTRELGTTVLKSVFTKASYRKRMIMGGILVVNNYAVLLYQGLRQTGSTPLLLSAVWITTAALIYNPLGAWLHGKVNSRRGMYLTSNCGQVITLSILTAFTAQDAGTSNKVRNGFAVFMIFLYLAFQGTFCDTTMYLYVSETFPYEMRTIGIGFSLFGQFAGTLIIVQSAPIAFAATARFKLEEIGEKFGDEVAVKITDAAGANEESRKELYEKLEHHEVLQRSEKGAVGS
ncbi:general substrate transporter [Leptodontidium sp. 2 PMI_412]|nr:general substrate transporter [Leptodontidium sp. 2 PMI_412]